MFDRLFFSSSNRPSAPSVDTKMTGMMIQHTGRDPYPRSVRSGRQRQPQRHVEHRQRHRQRRRQSPAARPCAPSSAAPPSPPAAGSPAPPPQPSRAASARRVIHLLHRPRARVCLQQPRRARRQQQRPRRLQRQLVSWLLVGSFHRSPRLHAHTQPRSAGAILRLPQE